METFYRVVGINGFDQAFLPSGTTKSQAAVVAQRIADRDYSTVQLLTVTQGKVTDRREIDPSPEEIQRRLMAREETLPVPNREEIRPVPRKSKRSPEKLQREIVEVLSRRR